jgi:hypothetical protein
VTRPSLPFLWLLLAAALFMRAVLPQGYMPERSDSGSIAVVVCGSGAIHRVPLADGTGRGEEEQQQRAEPPCAFAGIAAPAIPPHSPPELALPAPAALAQADRAPVVVPEAAPRLHPPARGPPLPA